MGNKSLQSNKIKDAKRIFTEILSRLDPSLSLKGESKDAKLNLFNDTVALLPKWMLISDEISVILTGNRLWDSYYINDDSSLLGFSVINNKDSIKTLNTESYQLYPVSEDVSFSLRYLICTYAIDKSILLGNKNENVFEIKERKKLKNKLEKNNNEHGSIIPFDSQDTLIMNYTNDVFESLTKVLSKNNDKSMSL